jgi:hypothetical protein
MTSIIILSPDDIMAFSPLIPKPDSGLPSASISLASPNNGLIPVEDQSTRIQLAYENEAYKVEKEGQPHTSDIVNKGNASNQVVGRVENKNVGCTLYIIIITFCCCFGQCILYAVRIILHAIAEHIRLCLVHLMKS